MTDPDVAAADGISRRSVSRCECSETSKGPVPSRRPTPDTADDLAFARRPVNDPASGTLWDKSRDTLSILRRSH
jgi:hypothetical protein